ncbi:hypothetical protein [Demequina soli]|uniref:hypothetical protein n=1 Tax=Demequina soli TaxID=1638987 RepID=UPI000785E5D5|nr:hypothetical protein [Demequina soli]
MRTSTLRWRALLVVLALLAGATGCRSIEISPPISSCHHYVAPSHYGSFTIQQRTRGASLQWGTYPNAAYSGTRYEVEVFVGGKRYDAKVQYYAPHGSVAAATARRASGAILRISGTVHRSGTTVLVFTMQCRIM